VKVIGLGTQDSLGQANDFDNKYNTTFDMLWDESFLSWQEIGVRSQPTVALLDPDGTFIQGWVGGIPEDTVLELAAQYAVG